MDVNHYPDFDRISFCYDLLKYLVFGSKIDDAQKQFLTMIPHGASVLIVGGGSGKILVDILLTRRPAEIVYLELSKKMLALTKRRLRRHQRKDDQNFVSIDFRLGSVEALGVGEKFDVVITPFVLDVIDAKILSGFMEKLDRALNAQGLWFFSDFRSVESQGLTSVFNRFLLNCMLLFFKLAIGLRVRKLPDFHRHFVEAGYQPIISKLFYKGFIQSAVLTRTVSTL